MTESKDIRISDIVANPYQPRLEFNQTAIEELSRSIKENGLIQPIVVRPNGSHYEIIAGERRFRACQLAKMTTVPCIIMNVDDVETAQMALVENIQRENLNAIEEAKAYVQMMRLSGMRQQDLANKMGKTQSTIANKIRLLNLCDEVQDSLKQHEITERHARAMLSLTDEQQKETLNQILHKKMTVKQTEDHIDRKFKQEKPTKPTIRTMTRNVVLARNTILQSVKMCEQANIACEVSEQDGENDYTITIRIKK